MKFTEHRDSNINTVKNYEAGKVRINADEYHQSLFLTQKEVFSDWHCSDIRSLTTNSLDALLDQKPEVIILGTGESQIFPEPKLFAHCTNRGAALEVMANDAACRTYNILTTEDREVVLALIFDEKSKTQ
ncbi:Mth938-like domain-containing protein [Thiomicrorhabdus indica]|uniref:Mth938-like domain-containing protein n=1 Tax=Thiomicrorhabdus indica TaxID=2267253 RepID=UPI00102DBDAB|nr:Mth938-like domain-containing protein [Thiomicrorhabdus indica]